MNYMETVFPQTHRPATDVTDAMIAEQIIILDEMNEIKAQGNPVELKKLWKKEETFFERLRELVNEGKILVKF
jgi:hypothetical protein